MCGVGEYKWRGKILGDFFYGKRVERVEKDNKKNRKGMKKRKAVCVFWEYIFPSKLWYGESRTQTQKNDSFHYMIG